MNPKHLKIRVDQVESLSKASSCPRRKVGAIILDPSSNSVISDGYNGPPRGACGDKCGGTSCLRDDYKIASGTNNDVGCHHAEANALMNAARHGSITLGKWLLVSCDPCLMCAKLIHHAGISRVYCPNNTTAHLAGLAYLASNNVELKTLGADDNDD